MSTTTTLFLGFFGAKNTFLLRATMSESASTPVVINPEAAKMLSSGFAAAVLPTINNLEQQMAEVR